MPRPSSALAGLLSILLAVIAGCTAAPLSRPAILGASASAGFGCEITADDGRPYLVDLEAVYQAMVPGWHDDPIFLADAGFYSRPREAPAEQMDAALARNPSVIVAVDYLFWSVYGARPSSMPADAVERDRHEALALALAQLDRFNGPVIVGDIPDMRAASGHMLSLRNIPPPEQLDAFNSRIREWAARRPRSAPAVVIGAAELGRVIEAGAPLPTAHGVIPAQQASALLQDDRLHPTASGLVLLLREGLTGLAAAGVIEPDDFRTDTAEITPRLAAEARAADARREPGLWTLLAVKGKMEAFDEAVTNKDCARAAELFDQVMEKTTGLKQSPHELATLFVSFTLLKYRDACPDAPQTIRRWRDRLDPAVERPAPDTWPFDLWSSFNQFLDEEHRTIDRALRMKRVGVPPQYVATIADAARSARYTDPAAYLELIPSWQSELDKLARLATQISDYWTAFAQSPQWPAYAQTNYEHALKSARTEERRREVEARREEYFNPRYTIATGRSHTLQGIAALELALRATGRADEAGVVHARLDTLAPANEVAAAREKAAHEAANAKPSRRGSER